MPKIRPELKQDLLERGEWGEFVRFRQELKLGGMANNEAHRQALKKFFPDTEGVFDSPVDQVVEQVPDVGGSEEISAAGGTVKRSRNKRGGGRRASSSTTATRSGGPSSSFPISPASSMTVKPGPVVPQSLPALPEVSSSDFGGRKASEVEVIRWVASNMEVVDPAPVNCPSAAAWGLLAQCRSSMIARSEFWKQTYPKLLPSKAQLDKEDEAVTDESKAVEVIQELLSFRNESILESGGSGAIWKEGEF